MAHPTENALSSSTYPQRQIFWLNNHRMNDPIETIAASTIVHHSDSHYVTLSCSPGPSLPHEILPVLSLGPASSMQASAQLLKLLCEPLDPLHHPR